MLLGVNGALAVLYAGIVPLPFTDTVVPAANVAVGAAWIAAALGVWRLRRLGRALGVVLCLWSIAMWIIALASALATSEPWSLWGVVLFSLGQVALLLGVPLWILLRRWPADR